MWLKYVVTALSHTASEASQLSLSSGGEFNRNRFPPPTSALPRILYLQTDQQHNIRSRNKCCQTVFISSTGSSYSHTVATRAELSGIRLVTKDTMITNLIANFSLCVFQKWCRADEGTLRK